MRPTLIKLATTWGEARTLLDAAKRVLIVDDDPGELEIFTAILENADFDCTAVASGEKALALFKSGDFDFLVVEKNLPGISGIEVIAQARQIDSDCEAVLITAYPSLESVLQAIDLQSVDYLTKPLDSIDVLTTVLGRARRRRNRRILSRRMLTDLRDAVSEKADDDTLASLRASRERVEAFRESLKGKKRVIVSASESAEVLTSVKQLEALQFEIWTVASGAEAMSKCARRHVSVLILSDTYDDMTGTQLAERVSDAEGRPELIYLTTRSDVTDALNAVERGAAGYIIKPLKDDGQLLHTVRRATENHHERLYHYRMIGELFTIANNLKKTPEGRQTGKQLEIALSEFDVQTARHVLPPFDDDAWSD